MGAIQLDTTQWPLAVFTCDGRQTDDDVTSFLADLERLLDREQPYLVMMDVRSYEANFAHVRRIGLWTKEWFEASRRHLAASALVVESEAFRMLLATFFLVVKMPVPFTCVTSRDEADAWLREQAEKAGLSLPAAG
jgi:SpoIIAA-like